MSLSPIHCIHVTDGATWGGIEANLLQMHLASERTGELRLGFVFSEEGEPSERFRAAGAQVTVLPQGRWNQWRALRRALAVADVVHVHGYFGAILGSTAAVGLTRTRVATLHGAVEPGSHLLTRVGLYARTARWLLQMLGARFIAVSRVTANHWMANGIPASKLTVIHNGIGPGDYVPADPSDRIRGPLDDSEYRVGIVGRLVPVKDHDLFLRVAQHLVGRNLPVHFVVIGDGPLREELEAAARELGVSEQTTFLGHCADVAKELSELDLLMITSESEGIPYALLEAMACGVPAVAPRIGGLPEILEHGRNALLAERRDPSELADLVSNVLSDGPLRGRLALGALETVRSRFSRDAMIEQTMAVYRRSPS